MSEVTAKRVLLKNKEGEYLLPKVAVANAPEEGNEDPITSDAVKAAIDAAIKSVPGGLAIGTFFAYPGAVPPEGAYLLNGQTIAGCNELYPKFWEWLVDNAGEMVATHVYKAWTMPALTVDGTLGGTEYAVQASGKMASSDYAAYKSFDGTHGGAKSFACLDNTKTGWLTWYSPVKLKVSKIAFQNATAVTAAELVKTFEIFGSNDNQTWYSLTSGTIASTAASATQIEDIPESKYGVDNPGYKYFKFEVVNGGGEDIEFPEITIYGQEYLYTDYAGNGNILTLTNEAYEHTLARTGVCGGFVLDTVAGSVRLPTLVNGTLWGADSGTIGQSLAAGLPNITGTLYRKGGSTDAFLGDNPSADGAFALAATGASKGVAGSDSGFSPDYATLDASRSSSIYGNSDTVQPPAIRVSWCIQVYNAATALSEQESAQLASQMQMKAQTDLANVTTPAQAFKSMVTTWGMPDYTAGVSIPANTIYTAETNGVLVFEFYRNGTGTKNSTVTVNGVQFVEVTCNDYDSHTEQVYLQKGDTCSFTGDLTNRRFIFYPMRGEK